MEAPFQPRGSPSALPTTIEQHPAGDKPVTVEDSGFTVLYDGSGSDGPDALVDIILIHGLGGGPRKTWATKSSSLSPSRKIPSRSNTPSNLGRRFFSKSRTEESSLNPSQAGGTTAIEANPTAPKPEKFWPAEFLPADFPQTRVLTWGYESVVTAFFSGAVNRSSYYSHARDLLYDVNSIRAHGCRRRPIIWIAHSLGGIIVKDVLLRAHSAPGGDETLPLKDIYDSTKAVIFLGTPHRGSSMASWGLMASHIVKAAGFDTNTTILEQIVNKSPELENLRERFSPLLQEKSFHVRTFQEGHGMKGMAGLNGKVVEDDSSTIDDSEPRRTIPANHMEMCRFSDKSDVGYRRIKDELNAFVQQVQNDRRRKVVTERPTSSLLDRLKDSQPSIMVDVPKSEKSLTLILNDAFPFDEAIEHGSEFTVFDIYTFHNAIKHGDEFTIRRQLEKGVDKEMLTERTMELAIGSGQVGIVELLLKNGANIEKKDGFTQRTPLLEATESHQHSIVKLLLQHGADTEATTWGRKTSLHIACENGNEDIVRDLLKAEAHVEAKDFNKKTPLHCAAESGNVVAVKLLLKAHARMEAQAWDRKTPLQFSVENGHADVVRLLISKRGGIGGLQLMDGKTLLHLASMNGHDEVVKILLKQSVEVVAKDWAGQTSLHLAAQNGHYEVVKLLCAQMINLEEKDGERNTPLLLAAIGGNALAANVLIDSGADIEAKDCRGLTALQLAFNNRHEEVVLLLLNKGACTEWTNGKSAVQFAAHQGKTAVVQALLDLGADIRGSKDGWPPLNIAASVGHTAVASLLVANKAELNQTNKTGATALHLASSNGYEDMVRLLLNYGADASLADAAGGYALYYAAYHGHDEVVTVLLRQGADIDARCQEGTAMSVACANGHESTAALLIKNGADIAGTGLALHSPLNAAALSGHSAVVDLLLKHSSSDEASFDLLTALHCAAGNGHIVVVKQLLSCGGIDINGKRDGGRTALHVAAVEGHDAVLRALLEAGADIDETCDQEWLPIHGAALNGHAAAIEVLLAAGSRVGSLQDMFTEDLSNLRRLGEESLVRFFVQAANVRKRFYLSIMNGNMADIRQQVAKGAVINMRDGSGDTGLHVAVRHNRMEIIQVLLDEFGVSVNSLNDRKRTALHQAVLQNNIEALRFLLGHGAALNATDADGVTALHGAVKMEEEEIVRILLEAGADTSIKDTFSGLTPLQSAEAGENKAITELLLGRVGKNL